MIPKFYNEEHETAYYDLLERMGNNDCYHQSFAYLVTLDTVCSEHINDLYNFDERGINLDGLNKGWQTGTSSRTTRLAFNLWNGYCYDYKNGEEVSRLYAVDYIFEGSYGYYYFEAIKLRYPNNTQP